MKKITTVTEEVQNLYLSCDGKSDPVTGIMSIAVAAASGRRSMHLFRPGDKQVEMDVTILTTLCVAALETIYKQKLLPYGSEEERALVYETLQHVVGRLAEAAFGAGLQRGRGRRCQKCGKRAGNSVDKFTKQLTPFARRVAELEEDEGNIYGKQLDKSRADELIASIRNTAR